MLQRKIQEQRIDDDEIFSAYNGRLIAVRTLAAIHENPRLLSEQGIRDEFIERYDAKTLNDAEFYKKLQEDSGFNEVFTALYERRAEYKIGTLSGIVAQVNQFREFSAAFTHVRNIFGSSQNKSNTIYVENIRNNKREVIPFSEMR